MIKFFRKIRYNLMGKGKTGKYLKYAIGEIVLVVIGILIALSINNWNENRKSKINEEAVLLKLLEDLKTDSINLNNQYTRAKLINKLHLDLYLIGQGKLVADSLKNPNRIRHGIIFNSAVRNTDSQLANKISNTNIRDQLVIYLNRLLFSKILLDNYRNLMNNRVRPYLAEWSLFDIDSRFEDPENPRNDILEDKLIEHLNQPTFYQLLYETNIKVESIIIRFDQLQKENSILKEVIINELEQNR